MIFTFEFMINAGKIAESKIEEKWGETSLQPCQHSEP